MTGERAVECPYVGLVPFTEADGRFFFGRENDQAIVISSLFACRLTILYGASGVGKSSLLRAGVMRELQRRAATAAGDAEEADLRVVYFKEWQDRPLERLVREIRRVTGCAEADGDRGAGLAGALADGARAFSGDLMVFLDQFEDYFKYPDPGPRTFVTEFAEAVHRSELPVSFLLSLRDDAVSRLDRFKVRIPNLFANTLRLEPLSREQATQAIVLPVEAFNKLPPAERAQPGSFSVEPALVDEVLDDVRRGRVRIGDAGGRAKGAATSGVEAPYLQLVMTRVWIDEVRNGSSSLRAETLKRLGGAEHIVQSHLDEVMKQLSKRERDLCASIFEHLVTPTGNKIAHTASDLAGYAAAAPEEVESLLARLSGSTMRILTPVAAPGGQEGSSHYEIYHDALGPAVLEWCRRYTARKNTRRRVWQWAPVGLAFASLLIGWALVQSQLAREAADHAVHLDRERTRAVHAETAAREEALKAKDAEERASRIAQERLRLEGNAEESARFKALAEQAGREKEQLAARIDARADSLDTLARENGRLKIQLDQATVELAQLRAGSKAPASAVPPRTITLGLRLRSVYVVQDGTAARTRWAFSVKVDGAQKLSVPPGDYNDKDPQPVPLQQSASFEVREAASLDLLIEGQSEERNVAVGRQTLVIPRLSDLAVQPTRYSALTLDVLVLVRRDTKQGTFVFGLELLPAPAAAK